MRVVERGSKANAKTTDFRLQTSLTPTYPDITASPPINCRTLYANYPSSICPIQLADLNCANSATMSSARLFRPVLRAVQRQPLAIRPAARLAFLSTKAAPKAIAAESQKPRAQPVTTALRQSATQKLV